MSPANLLFLFGEIDQFAAVKDIDASVAQPLIEAVRSLDEREQLEPFIRSILSDPNETPHGPAEIADIFTHKVTVGGHAGLAAFVLKGKSFSTVRPTHVSHQIYRLEKISGLRFAVLAASGTVLDAAKEQFCSTAERLGVRYCLLDASDLARLLVAYGFLCPRDGTQISAGRCHCGYSPQFRILNFLQSDALEAFKAAHAMGQRSGLVVLPTGSGKTRIAAEAAKIIRAGRVLYAAHTHEILDVAQSEFEGVFGSTHVVRLATPRALQTPARINLATVQFLSNNLRGVGKAAFDFVVVDEFHHAAARSYRSLLEQCHPQFLLGLTATPFRADRQDIAALCSHNVLVNYELRSGIETGVLCPYHYFGCFDDIDYEAVQSTRRPLGARDLERLLIVPERDKAIVRKWTERADGKPTIAFCCSQKHAQRVAQSFRDAGIPAATYISTTAAAERRDLAKRQASGAIKIICVVDVLNEGADFPFVECLLFLRPTDSKRVFYQQLGRGLRRYVGKSHCVVIDFIGNFKNAYRIVEYQGLLPEEDESTPVLLHRQVTKREILNLPEACEVHFEDKVIDLFAQQALDPKYATRHNIGRILLYQYERLYRRLGHLPTRRELDRHSHLDSRIYVQLFGSWQRFQEIAESAVAQ